MPMNRGIAYSPLQQMFWKSRLVARVLSFSSRVQPSSLYHLKTLLEMHQAPSVWPTSAH